MARSCDTNIHYMKPNNRFAMGLKPTSLERSMFLTSGMLSKSYEELNPW